MSPKVPGSERHRSTTGNHRVAIHSKRAVPDGSAQSEHTTMQLQVHMHDIEREDTCACQGKERDAELEESAVGLEMGITFPPRP